MSSSSLRHRSRRFDVRVLLVNWGASVMCAAAVAELGVGARGSPFERGVPTAAVEVDTTAERAAAILEAAATAGESAKADSVRALALMGRRVVPILFDRLTQGMVVGESDSKIADASRDTRQEIVLAALVELPLDSVRTCIERRCAGAPDGKTRLAALTALGACGMSFDYDLISGIATPALDPDAFEGPIARALAGALCSIARRDPGLWDRMRKSAPTAPVELQRAMLRAGTISQGTQGLHFLGWAFQALPNVRLEAVVEMQRAASSGIVAADEEVLRPVRNALDLEEPALLADLVLLEGRFEDGTATPKLIELLEHPSGAVKASAEWSLRQISGLSLGSTPTRWRRWSDEEHAWWRDESETQIARLRSPSSSDVNIAILELSRHRLFRNRLAEEIADLLDDSDVEVVRVACAVLEQIRSVHSLPGLVAALGHRDEKARLCVWTCLQKITGRNYLPGDPAWRELVDRP